ncbi:MAG: hypothetical protein Fur003_2890 [Candidatus Dojkabacteria bacterium]
MKGIKDFSSFLREQGIVGLAVGFILGGSVSKLAHSLVDDIISPILSLFLGRVESLERAVFQFHEIEIKWGLFLKNSIDFIIIAAVVFFLVKGLKLDKLDKPKELANKAKSDVGAAKSKRSKK